MEYIEKADVSIGDASMGIEVETQIEVIPDASEVPVEVNFTSMESTDNDLSEEVSVRGNFDLKSASRTAMPESYAEYSLLSVEEKVELFAIADHADSFDVIRLVMQYFKRRVTTLTLMKLLRNLTQSTWEVDKIASVKMRIGYEISYRKKAYRTCI